MAREGVIFEIKKNYFIIMDKQGNFIKLKYKEGSYEGQKIFYTNEDIYKELKYKKISAYAAVIMLILIPTFIFYSLNSVNAAAVIAVDINPSMEFMIDKNEKVIEMHSLDEESKSLIDKEWIGESYAEILHMYLNAADAHGYIKADTIILVSSTFLNDDLDSAKIQDITEKIIEQMNTDFSYVYNEEKEEDLREAQKENLSAGKYKLYNEILNVHPEVEVQELKNRELKDLKKFMEDTEHFIIKKVDKNKNKYNDKDNDKKKGSDIIKDKNKEKDSAPAGNDRNHVVPNNRREKENPQKPDVKGNPNNNQGISNNREIENPTSKENDKKDKIENDFKDNNNGKSNENSSEKNNGKGQTKKR